MKDLIIKGTGNSRSLKSVVSFLSLYPTYADFAAALIEGTLPIDIGPLNPQGVQQMGTALNKANLLSDATAEKMGLSGNPSVDDALLTLHTLAADNPYLWDGPKKLGSLAAGALVKLNENGQAKKFIVLGKDHYGPNTGVTLIRKDTFGNSAWNAGSVSNNAGITQYFGGTLDSFCDGIWPLKLDKEIQQCIIPVPIVVAEGNKVATLHTIYRKGFVLSGTETGFTPTSTFSFVTEGTTFSYFSSDEKRIAYLDGTETQMYWWTRSPQIDDSGGYSCICIRNTGVLYSVSATFSSRCAPRPAFNLKPELVISSSTDSDGCYTFVKKGAE